METVLQLCAFWYASSLDGEDPLVKAAVWGSLAVVTVGTLAAYTTVCARLLRRPDRTVFVYFEPKRHARTWRLIPDSEREAAEARVLSHFEYDIRRLAWMALRDALSAAVLVASGLYLKTLTPAIAACIMAPFLLISEPLIAVHLLGKVIARPFLATPNSWSTLLGGSLADVAAPQPAARAGGVQPAVAARSAGRGESGRRG